MKFPRVTYITLILFTLACNPDQMSEFTPNSIGVIDLEANTRVALGKFSASSGGTPAQTAIKQAVKSRLKENGVNVVKYNINKPENYDVLITCEVINYHYVPEDEITMMPGWLLPGCIPFGLIGGIVGWVIDDSEKIAEFSSHATVTVSSADDDSSYTFSARISAKNKSEASCNDDFGEHIASKIIQAIE